MQNNTPTSAQHPDLETWKKAMESRRKVMQQKYHLPDDLAALLGCIPPITDEEMEKEKDAYLKEKYGR